MGGHRDFVNTWCWVPATENTPTTPSSCLSQRRWNPKGEVLAVFPPGQSLVLHLSYPFLLTTSKSIRDMLIAMVRESLFQNCNFCVAPRSSKRLESPKFLPLQGPADGRSKQTTYRLGVVCVCVAHPPVQQMICFMVH